MREERTVVMSNVRASSPSYVSLDDGALNDLEAAAHLVGASASPRAQVHASWPARMSPSQTMAPRTAAMAKDAGVKVVAFVAGGLVALVTAATLVFYFVVP